MKLWHQPKPIAFTKEGFTKKKQEYEELLAKRPAAVLDLKKAREMGDLSENGYYKAARFNLSSIDRRLREYRYILHYGKVMQTTGDETVQIGSTVLLSGASGEKKVTIVGDYEADPKVGKISSHSPLGKELIGKKQNDAISVSAPQGDMSYTIMSISS